MQYQFGDIVLIDFPFSDSIRTKRRPALVIYQDGEDDILLARITSKPKESLFEAKITNWKESKLLFPSTVRLGKLATLSIDLIEIKIGELTETDRSEVIATLEKLVASIKER